MKTATKQLSTKDRILEVASRLFYTQGYNATGIQQIIDEAGVSKGSFYTHFKTKDHLALEYLRKTSSIELGGMKSVVSDIKDPKERFKQFMDIMKEWMISTNYRGCAFLNMAAEVTDLKSPIRKEAKYHYEGYRAVLRDIVDEYLKSDPKLKGMDAQFIADQYMMLAIGALTNSEVYQDTWPFDHAKKAMLKLVGEKG